MFLFPAPEATTTEGKPYIDVSTIVFYFCLTNLNTNSLNRISLFSAPEITSTEGKKSKKIL